jgi:hypothetical protein
MPSTISAGTTAGTAIAVAGDTTGNLAFQTNGTTTAMTIDTSQNVGIGTTTMTRNLNIGNSTNAVGISLQNTGTSGENWSIFSTNAGSSIGGGNLGFYNDTDSAYRMIIDGSGRVTMPAQPAFFAGIGSVSDATFALNTFLPYNQTVLNTGGFFNTSTNKFTAPVAGRYFFSWNTFYTDSGGLSNDMQTGLNVNGSYISFSGGDAFVNVARPSTSGVICIGCSAVVNLAANDVVGIMARTNNVRVYQGHCNFSGYLVG